MGSITSYLASLGPWSWFIAAAVLLALETIVPGVHFLWFGMAAIATGLVVLALGALAPASAEWLSWPLQVLLFAALSIATVFVVRRWARPDHAESDLPDLNARAAQYVGRNFVVAETIADGRGKIRVGDTLWQAEGPDTPQGTHVRVAGTRGTVLLVERLPA